MHLSVKMAQKDIAETQTMQKLCVLSCTSLMTNWGLVRSDIVYKTVKTHYSCRPGLEGFIQDQV